LIAALVEGAPVARTVLCRSGGGRLRRSRRRVEERQRRIPPRGTTPRSPPGRRIRPRGKNMLEARPPKWDEVPAAELRIRRPVEERQRRIRPRGKNMLEARPPKWDEVPAASLKPSSHSELDSAVSELVVVVLFGIDLELRLAEPGCGQASAVDPLRYEVVPHRVGSLLAEIQVDLSRAVGICVALDLDAADRVLTQHGHRRVEDGQRNVIDRSAAATKQYGLEGDKLV